jgi:hypothetical protein
LDHCKQKKINSPECGLKVEAEIDISCHQQKHFIIGGGQHFAQNQEEKPSIAKIVTVRT